MFDTLSDKLQRPLGDLRGRGTLDEETITRAMREVRLALLEADVNFDVVKQFVAQVRERALGQEVQKSLTPGQQVVKIVHEELTELMGSGSSQIAFSPRPPTTILLAGLQGSGKTTAAGKLALLLKNDGKKPALVAADLQRPAAIDQLVQLGAQVGVPVYADERSDPVKAVRDGIDRARARRPRRRHPRHRRPPTHRRAADGRARRGTPRREADERAARPRRDDRTGSRQRRAGVPGAHRLRRRRAHQARRRRARRRGASVKAVTGKPIKFASVGEKLDALEPFHPDRMAGRILGMGDVLTLIERAESAVADDEKEELERRMLKGEFSFDDFLKSYKMLRRMGPLQGVLKMIPGLGKQLEGLDQVDEAARPGGGDHPLDDPTRAPRPARDRWLAAPAHRCRQRHLGRAGEPADRGPKADGEDDEDDGIGQDARTPGRSAYHAERQAAPERDPQVVQQAKEEESSMKEESVWQ